MDGQRRGNGGERYLLKLILLRLLVFTCFSCLAVKLFCCELFCISPSSNPIPNLPFPPAPSSRAGNPAKVIRTTRTNLQVEERFLETGHVGCICGELNGKWKWCKKSRGLVVNDAAEVVASQSDTLSRLVTSSLSPTSPVPLNTKHAYIHLPLHQPLTLKTHVLQRHFDIPFYRTLFHTSLQSIRKNNATQTPPKCAILPAAPSPRTHASSLASKMARPSDSRHERSVLGVGNLSCAQFVFPTFLPSFSCHLQPPLPRPTPRLV